MTDEELKTLIRSIAAATAKAVENTRESMSYRTQIVADGLELAAVSQRTAAEAMELMAHTTKAIHQLSTEIAELKQIVGIGQTGRSRISNLHH